MKDWNKRSETMLESGRRIAETSGQQASRLLREFGGKWLPSAMRGAASGLESASKALKTGAKRLKKNVKTSMVFTPEPGMALAPARAQIRR